LGVGGKNEETKDKTLDGIEVTLLGLKFEARNSKLEIKSNYQNTKS
jgi:hypothetical protein